MEEQVSGDWSGADYAEEAGHHRSFDDWFLDRLPPETDDVVVDVGCGSGEFTARLAEIVAEGRAIGVEPDPSMLQAARRHENPRLEFLQASAEDLAHVVEAGSVDKVMSRAMLHWIPVESYPQVFRGVFSVLRPGGWFHSDSAGAGNVPNLVALVESLAGRFDLPRPHPFPDAGVAFDLVEEAGFEITDEGVRTIAQRRSFTREQAVGLIRTQGSVAVTRHSDDEEERAAIEEAAVSDIDRLRRSDGTFDQTFVRLEILARKPD